MPPSGSGRAALDAANELVWDQAETAEESAPDATDASSGMSGGMEAIAYGARVANLIPLKLEGICAVRAEAAEMDFHTRQPARVTEESIYEDLPNPYVVEWGAVLSKGTYGKVFLGKN